MRQVVFAACVLSPAASLHPQLALQRATQRHSPPCLSASVGSLCIYGDSEDAEWLSAGVAAVRKQNAEVLPLLQDLRERRFFRLYAADLLASCSYMPTSEEPCELGECEVDAVEEVPDELVERDEAEASFELDSWARWDQPSDFTEYYDLVENAETHTNYDGSAVWAFIHTKICFQKDVDQKGNEWKGDFNRLVSGMHSTVAASIVRDMEARGDTELAMAEYRRRLRDEPAAVANLHFTYMLVLCAVADMRERLDGCSYLGEAPELIDSMQRLTASPLLTDPAVQLAATNLRAHVASETATSWKLRLRTRDLLRVMNCVQCNLCRLHGKVQALGLASALNVLLGLQGRGEEGCNRAPDPTSLHRVEVAALVTTCAKLSAACELVRKYETMDAGEPSGAGAAAPAV